MRTITMGALPALAVAAGLVLDAGPARAQASGRVSPGQIERQFKSLPEPRGAGAETAPPLLQRPLPREAESLRFVLSDIVVDGTTRYTPDMLKPLLAPYLGHEVTLADLYRLADELSARYRNDGLLLSQVIVPAQTVEGGRARLQAIEGFVSTVQIEGAAAKDRALIAAYAEKIQRSRPLTREALERYMLLINDLPGVYATAALAPAQADFGAAELIVQVSERKLEAGLSVDNRGGRTLGKERIIADAAFANLLGRHDNTGLKLVASPGGELAYAAMRHEQQLGAEGGKLSLNLSATRAKPDDQSFVPLELETRSRNLDLGLAYPLLRSRAANLYLRGGLSMHDGEERVFGVKDREDHLRSLRIALTYDFPDRHGGTSVVDVEASHGLESMGASDNGDPLLTRPDGRVDYSKLTLFAARLQDLDRSWSLLTAFSGQYAFNELLSSELFAFGGEPFGRGYDPSELVGDHGAAIKLELRYAGLWQHGRTVPYQFYSFYDLGRVWSRADTPGGDLSAASLGMGLRASLASSLTGFIELAKPLTREVAAEESKAARLYLGLAARM